MTTNVRDSSNGYLASDSRWTWDLRPHGHTYQLLLDDAGYEKIISAKSSVFMFAGDALVIDAWKQAIKVSSDTGAQVAWSNLPINGMAISIVNMPSGSIRYEFGHEIDMESASFAGTGSYGAAGCWLINKCAKKAVESAKSTDPHTGGTVRYQNFLTGENNLVPDGDLNDLIPQFLTRSIVMTANTTHSEKFSEVAANDDELRQVLYEARAQGSGPKAPCDAVFNVWPSAEKAKLVAAMENLFAN